MKLKCPSCSKLLQIPDSAAGKVVKCPCGKQLRVPTPKQTTGSPQSAGTPLPTGSRQPAGSPQPVAAPQRGFSNMRLDDGLFDELTESDLAPVAATAMPASSPSSHNPYAAPMSSAHSPPVQLSGRAASQNKRFLNFILDSVVIQVLSFVIGLIVGVVMVVAYGDGVTPDQEAMMGLIATILGFLFYLVYYIFLEAVFGVTIGKLITGTRVTSENGGPAGFGKILGRTLARFIPFEPLSYLFGDTTKGWHDTLSGTRVIDIRNG